MVAQIKIPAGSLFKGKIVATMVVIPQEDMIFDVTPLDEIPEIKVWLEALPEMIKEMMKVVLSQSEEAKVKEANQRVEQYFKRGV